MQPLPPPPPPNTNLPSHAHSFPLTLHIPDLFPFGGDNDDLIVPTGIAASDISILNEPITFFGHQYRQIIVSVYFINFTATLKNACLLGHYILMHG